MFTGTCPQVGLPRGVAAKGAWLPRGGAAEGGG